MKWPVHAYSPTCPIPNHLAPFPDGYSGNILEHDSLRHEQTSSLDLKFLTALVGDVRTWTASIEAFSQT